MAKKIESREIMINKDGKPLFAVRIDNGSNDAAYVYIQDGDIKFSSSWFSSITPYELGNESHRLAKEIFTIGLQAAVKTKIYELKQLESILNDLNLSECLGNVMVDNTKLLLEVSEKMEGQKQAIIDVTEDQIKKVSTSAKREVKKAIKETVANEVKPCVEEAITETVRPIAIKKKKKTEETN